VVAPQELQQLWGSRAPPHQLNLGGDGQADSPSAPRSPTGAERREPGWC
jgi:hypothetical protein